MSRFFAIFAFSLLFLFTNSSTAATSVEEIKTDHFTAKISEKGLIDFQVSGENVSAVESVSFRWLTRGADGKGNDWPGSAIGIPLQCKLMRMEDGKIELSQTFEDFEFLWKFYPESDGKALNIDMKTTARRNFISSEGSAHMPEIKVPDVHRVIWPSGKTIFDAPPKEAKGEILSANWVAFPRGPSKASILMFSKNPDWCKDVRFFSPTLLRNENWPGNVQADREFSMALQIMPYIGNVELAVESLLPKVKTPDINLPGGFALWSADNLELVPHEASAWPTRLSEPLTKPIDLQLAKGEVEALQLVFTPATGYTYQNVSLKFSELSHEDGKHKLPAGTFSWRRIHYYNITTPDILLDVQSFDTLAGQDRNYPLWIDVHMPYEALAGKWKATVTLISKDKVLASREIVIDVWNFQIPKKTSFNTSKFAFWREILSFQLGLDRDSEEYKKMFQAGVESLSAHRISHGDDTMSPVPIGITPEGALTKEGHKEFMKWCEFWIDRGLSLGCVRVVGRVDTPENKKLVKDFWEFYWPIFKERGWDKQIYHQHPDEFASEEDVRQCIYDANFIRQYAPGLKMQATAISAGETVYEAVDKVVDIWGTSPYMWKTHQAFLEKRLEAGEQVWPYIHHHIRFLGDGLAPRTFFWQLNRMGSDGCVLFSLNVWHDKEKVFTWTPEGLMQTKTFGGYPYGEGVLYWPAPDYKKLLESVRLEKIRDGIEDWECLKMLQERLKSSQELPGYENWCRKARLVLLLRGAVTSGEVLPTEVFNHTNDPSVFREIRNTMGETLDEWSNIKAKN